MASDNSDNQVTFQHFLCVSLVWSDKVNRLDPLIDIPSMD